MPRPTKCRRVGFSPQVTYFKPTGIPMRFLETVALSLEELEAIRLKDREGMQQEDCARLMGISRPTFHRVLGSARSKIADALLNAKAIRIEGGDFELVQHRFRCGWDGHEWDVSVDELQGDGVRRCPKCKRLNVEPLRPIASQADDGFPGGHRRGRCGKKD